MLKASPQLFEEDSTDRVNVPKIVYEIIRFFLYLFIFLQYLHIFNIGQYSLIVKKIKIDVV